ncbi:FAD-binding oxidoreductase [Roseateles sp. DAIF2]|uniref:NAD(P)/FAD-dependent oxidoreductase n=1 Tax=Roseateles sp. DAIF2 TaxID=2714952 RepID=UPI0018A289FA|nr:FAD-binding oxidoreductase [Roseateles sp. DAIF2]QPF74360.1 FAD-binding oxidoreductase [Roseateles sp. DAIF2]
MNSSTSSSREVLVLGAGMVGTCTALELALRGHSVTLVDRREPGRETSYGNAGVIQREAVEPYAFPRDLPTLLTAAWGRRLDIRWQLGGLCASWPQLLRYWWHSAPRRHRSIGQAYASLIAHATSAHQRYIELAGAGELVQRQGLRLIYRQPRRLEAALAESERLRREHGIDFAALDAAALAAAEPALRLPLAGAVHWLDSWSVSDPGALVERYAALFQRSGGRLLRGDADSLSQTRGGGWQVDTEAGRLSAAQAVVALGPWSDACIRRFGYRLPLFPKRGYHRHFSGGATLQLPTLDAERGYVLAPQSRGLRLTTGAEIARLDAPPRLAQIEAAEAEARQLLELGRPVEAEPWLGSRPCSADMKPVIGAAPRHPGLWFNFAHGHQGFTLGPTSAGLLADLMTGRPPLVEAAPFLPARFAPA